jgi:hypothetical protein
MHDFKVPDQISHSLEGERRFERAVQGMPAMTWLVAHERYRRNEDSG